ncbi:LamG domain-containing protein [Flavobacterium sp. SUN052]|uniref:LamG domain-containing protein n=1 Tax=Flavobacterium sp. SUN052 TaxID=3002441 RepID=UPI00237D4518|nr:LamG domain-containing protein [Flavobacterium sp. SUN052]MEC4004968.1 LamG domain-containing protein [Flavobacterium sp. SUN052]
MKKILSLLALILISSCNNTETDKVIQTNQSCLSGNLQNGIIAFYPFSSGSLNDYSGNNYNLTNPTTASSGADREGNPNCAFNFIKANNEFLKYINPSFIDNFQTLPFSISVWYKPIGTWSFECLIGRDMGVHCPDTYGQWSVSLYDGRKPVFGINEYSLWYNPAILYNPADYNDVWQHLVVTCYGNDLKLYRNGILTPNNPSYGGGGNCSPPSQPTLNIGDLFLGKEYNGLLDDVIIYNRVISQSEVIQLYNLAACCQ